MKPVSYTIKNGITTFHYPFSFLKEFLTLGKRNGNVGVILTKREENVFTYRGFGTIKMPRKYMYTFYFQDFDFKKPQNDEDFIKK